MPARGSRIGDLIRQRGDISAQFAAQPSPWLQAMPQMINQLGGTAMQFQQNVAAQKQMDDYARAYGDFLKIMRPGGIGF